MVFGETCKPAETSLGVACAGGYSLADSYICKAAPCRRPTQESQSNTDDFGDTSTCGSNIKGPLHPLMLETLLELARGLT